jgi:hypothetical protein
MVKKPTSEVYCFSCECLLLTDEEKHGPFCRGCFQKTKRKDPLTRAAIARTVVAVVPTLCPHDGKPHGNCRYSAGAHFNVIVLNKRLEPVEITGPYTSRAADRRAKVLRSRFRKDRN